MPIVSQPYSFTYSSKPKKESQVCLIYVQSKGVHLQSLLFSRACIANRKMIEQRVGETKLFHSQALALRNPHALT